MTKNELKDLRDRINDAGEWNPVDISELMKSVDMVEAFEEADAETFESVIWEALDRLDAICTDTDAI